MITPLTVILLLAANAFFCRSRIWLSEVPGVSFRGPRRRSSLWRTAFGPDRQRAEHYLGACQIGITMASLGLGSVGEPAVAALWTPALSAVGLSPDVVHSIAFIVGFIVFASLHST